MSSHRIGRGWLLALIGVLSLSIGAAQGAPPRANKAAAPAWSATERWVWDAVRAGRVADLDARCGKVLESSDGEDKEWRAPCRTISARFLETVLTDPLRTGSIGHRGLLIHAARVTGALNLDSAEVPGAVSLENSRFEGTVSLFQARFKLFLSLADSTILGGLHAPGISVEGKLDLSGTTSRGGALDLENASVGGSLDLDGARVEEALMMEGVKTGHGLWLRNALVAGVVNIQFATIGENLLAQGAVFGAGFNGEQLRVAGLLSLRRAIVQGGDLGLQVASVGQQLDLESAMIEGSLNGEALTVGGAVIARRLSVGGVLHLAYSTIAGTAEFNGGTVAGAVEFGFLRAAQSLWLRGNVGVGGRVDLANAHVGGMVELSNSFFASGVDATRLDVGGTLMLGGSSIRRGPSLDQTPALSLQQVKVGGSASLEAVNVDGDVGMNSAVFGGALLVRNAWITGSLDVGGARVGINLELDGSTISEGILARNLDVRAEFSANTLVCGGIGLRLEQARVAGSLVLDTARLDGPLDGDSLTVGGSIWIRNAVISGHLKITLSRIGGDIELTRSSLLGGVNARDFEVRGEVDIIDATIGPAGLVLNQGHIGASLTMDNSGNAGPLLGDSLTVGGSVFLRDASVAGELVLTVARVGGNVELARSALSGGLFVRGAEVKGDFSAQGTNAHGEADGDHLKVAGDFLGQGSTFERPLGLGAAEIKGHLELSDATLRQGLQAESLETGGNLGLAGVYVWLDRTAPLPPPEGWRTSQTAINLLGARIGGVLNARGARMNGEVSLEGTQTGASLLMEGLIVGRDLKLLLAKIGGAAKLNGLIVVGSIDATGLTVASILEMVGASVESGVNFAGMQAGANLTVTELLTDGDLVFDGARVTGAMVLAADRPPVQRDRVGGQVRLRSLRVGRELTIGRIVASGGVDASLMQVGGRAAIASIQSGAGALSLDGAKVEETLSMGESLLARGISAVNARVGGDLVLERVSALANGITLRGAKVDGEMKLTAMGPVRAHVEGSLDFSRLQTGGSLLIDSMDASPGAQPETAGETLRPKPKFDLTGAMIGREVTVQNSAFWIPVTMDGLHAQGDVRVTDTSFSHPPTLQRAVIEGNLHIAGTSLPGLDLTLAQIRRNLILSSDGSGTRWRDDATLTLRNTRVGGLADDPVKPAGKDKEQSAWPNQVVHDGFVWEGPNVERGPEASLDWLGRDNFRPESYVQAAAQYRAAGESWHASQILFESRMRETSKAWTDHQWVKAFAMTVFGLAVGFGLGMYTFMALVWVLGFTILGAIVLHFATQEGPRRGLFWRLAASLDRLVPLVGLSPDFARFFGDPIFRKHEKLAFRYFCLHAAVGYVLLSFLVAALAGFVQPR